MDGSDGHVSATFCMNQCPNAYIQILHQSTPSFCQKRITCSSWPLKENTKGFWFSDSSTVPYSHWEFTKGVPFSVISHPQNSRFFSNSNIFQHISAPSTQPTCHTSTINPHNIHHQPMPNSNHLQPIPPPAAAHANAVHPPVAAPSERDTSQSPRC